MSVSCVACGAVGTRDLYTAPGFNDRSRQYTLRACSGCGLVSADVSPADIAEAYEADYYKEAYPDYESDAPVHDRNAHDLLSSLERFVPQGRLLEVGSAFGFFLRAAKSRGWHGQGFEFSRHASSVARDRYGVDVRNEDFVTAQIEPGVDLVCMLDTIEHLLDPSAMIAKAAAVLRPGGALYMTTGDLASPFARLCGKRWRMIAPPLHVWYFSPDTLGRLLTRHGFRVELVEHPAKRHDLASVLRYFSGGRLGLPRSLPVPLNLGDIMGVLARREAA